jgi:putative signal transducing protein
VKRVHMAKTVAEAHVIKGILESEGIASDVRGESLSGAVGTLPLYEAWPSVWVADEDAERADQLVIAAFSGEGGSGEAWTCPGCGEELEGQFSDCWQCGTSDPTRGPGEDPEGWGGGPD